MSEAPLLWNSNLPPLAATVGRQPKSVPDRLTVQGVFLFAIGLLMVTSAFERFRVSMGNLQVHLYLFVLAPFFLYMVVTRIRTFPALSLAALMVFCGMYIISTFGSALSPWSESLKISASAATIITAALMVRSVADFRAAVLGLSIAVGCMAFFNLETADKFGANVMETGNKNAYSLYALPAMLLAGYVVVKKKSTSMLVKGILLGCTFGALMVIFMGGNRSGWIGCLLIALMLMVLRGFNVRGAIVMGILGYAVYYAIIHFGTTYNFQYRFQQTFQGSTSDTRRKELFLAALEVGLENPVAGVSPQYLPYELGRRLELGLYAAPHNAIGQVVGGNGLICAGALVILAISLWRLKPENPNLPISADFREARRLLQMTLFLWFFRGMFTGEILYSPAFSLAIGLAVGLCLAIERREEAQAKLLAPRPRMASPGVRPLPGFAT